MVWFGLVWLDWTGLDWVGLGWVGVDRDGNLELFKQTTGTTRDNCTATIKSDWLGAATAEVSVFLFLLFLLEDARLTHPSYILLVPTS